MTYEQAYQESLNSPEKFWAEAAKKVHLNWSKVARLIQTLLEIGLLSLSVYICYRDGRTPKDFVIVVFCAMLIASASTGKSLIAAICNNRILKAVLTKLGKLSYVMFLNHFMILYVLKAALTIGQDYYLTNIAIFLGVTVIYSFFADAIVKTGVNGIRKLTQGRKEKLANT